MRIQDYVFNVGDKAITTSGEIGKIVNICRCSSCVARGFYEPSWITDGATWHRYITKYDAEDGFNNFYQIGQYRFNDFDKGEVLREMADHEDALKELKKRLKVIEELEEGICITYD